MKWLVYNLLFAIAFPLMLPGFLLRMLRRGGYRARMLDRFGLYPKPVAAAFAQGGDFVWVHAVSVGEVQVAGQLMREWRAAEPDVRFCFSTTSSTGWQMAAREVTDRDVLIYNPLDFPSFVKSALAAVRPRAVVLTESEIWPVFIRRAHRLGIPLFLVNARVSDRSAPRYRAARWFFRDVFGCFTRIFAQSALDRDRLLAAGAPRDRVQVTGSFKFDVARRNPEKEAELRAWTGPGRILLGGSTWPGEDEVLLRLAAKLPDVTPVIAPRHFEKADAVEASIRRAGFACVRRSRGDRPPADGRRAVFLADTTGELMGLYGIADAVFVGKSLCEHGSQNMIEPCLCGKPTVVGPYTENFRPVMSDLLEAGGIVQVADAAALEKTVLGWFAEGDGGLGERAAAAVARRRGVVPKCVRTILAAIPRHAPARPRHGGGRVAKGLLATLAVLLALAGVCWSVRTLRDRARAAEAAAALVFPPLRTIAAHIALLEKPDARRVYLADAGAAAFRTPFAHAGLVCDGAGGAPDAGRYDIVLVTESSPRRWRAALARVSENGVLAWALDARGMTAAAFKAALEAFPCPAFHFWMPSENAWLVVGRRTPRWLKLSAVLELFGRADAAMEDLAAAECEAVSDLFASYVGSREEVMGAFAQGDLRQEVRPEVFVSAELPTLDWITNDVDEDIFLATGEAFNRVQAARRLVLEGAMRARDVAGHPGSGLDAMLEKWKAATALNAHDPMMLDRLHRLQINAWTMERVGNFKGAANCYEMMLVLRPRNAEALKGYSRCLRFLGQGDFANELIKKAQEIEK